MDLPLFEEATRRAVLRRGLTMTGALLAGGILAACGASGDKDAFSSSTTSAPASSTSAPTTTKAAASSTTAGGSSTTAGGGSTATGLVTVAFTYGATSSSGRVNNPFVAAWVEDASSALVGVIGVVYLARESKYLRELTSWAAASTKVTAKELDAVTGATRSAGSYSFQWNGKGLDGSTLKGAHTLWIEAAREHGPHSATSGPVVLGSAGKVTIPANGELSAATVTLA